MPEIHGVEISYENKRGCGFRTAGEDGVGIYLVSDGIWEPCERLPMPLLPCPLCNQGLKHSRGFTWILPANIFGPNSEPTCDAELSFHHHASCAACSPNTICMEKEGLLWVGEKFYTPDAFLKEAHEMGVSRKVKFIPKDFVLGENFVFLAHVKGCLNPDPDPDDEESPEHAPAIFSVFRPGGVDLVIEDENDIPDKATRMKAELGDTARIVKVVPVEDSDGSEAD